MEELLEVTGLNKSFGGLRAVNNVDFSVSSGIIKGIIGPNGAGKSTLFNLIAGRTVPDSGKVFLGGKNITARKPHNIARAGIAGTFQTSRLFPQMSVLDNVKVGRHIKTKAGFFSCMLNLPYTWKEEKAAESDSLAILEELELLDLAYEEAGNLAFGRQRLVEFARALAMEPVILMLDEPAAGLNMRETAELAELIVRIKDRGITVLIVEHDMSLVMNICDELLVLDRGKKLVEGKPLDIQKNPEVIKVYLGDDDD